MVLIVDDDTDICTLLLKIVQMAGSEGHAVYGGQAALDWLEGHHADLMILDVDMPELSGLDALKRLRSQTSSATLPVIIHTGSTAELIAQTATDFGASKLLVKGSYDVSEMIDLIKSFTSPRPLVPPAAA